MHWIIKKTIVWTFPQRSNTFWVSLNNHNWNIGEKIQGNIKNENKTPNCKNLKSSSYLQEFSQYARTAFNKISKIKTTRICRSLSTLMWNVSIMWPSMSTGKSVKGKCTTGGTIKGHLSRGVIWFCLPQGLVNFMLWPICCDSSILTS